MVDYSHLKKLVFDLNVSEMHRSEGHVIKFSTSFTCQIPVLRLNHLEAERELLLLDWCLLQNRTRIGALRVQGVRTKYLLELFSIRWTVICAV